MCPQHGLHGVTAEALERLEDGPLLGHTLDGRYVLMAYIGGGGMGAVYRGRQLSVGRDVAIKVLHASLTATREDRQRFEDEARAISLLQSRHTVTLYDFGVVRDGPLTHMAYMVLEFVEGETIAQRARAGTVPLPELVAILDGVADALDEAHAQGIVHRDLKPANIILSRDHRGAPLVKVIDFGVARFGEGTGHTRTGFSVGTPSYMAPEQFDAAGSRQIDGRADVYAMGVVCYVLVTGQKPFSSLSVIELAQMHRHVPPPALPGSRDDARVQAIEGVLHEALAKDPDHRFDTMGAFARAMRAAVAVPAELPAAPTQPLPMARPVGPPPSPTPTESFIGMIDAPPPPRRRRRGLVAVLAVVVLGGAGGGLVAHRLGQTDAPAPAAQPVVESVSLGERDSTPEIIVAQPATDALPAAVETQAAAIETAPPAALPSAAPAVVEAAPETAAPAAAPETAARPRPRPTTDPRLPALEQRVRAALQRCQCRAARASLDEAGALAGGASLARRYRRRVDACVVPDVDEVCRDGKAVSP
ncbi:MAG: serine/threonine protein kinase [Myxococcales bacterium]|nr:serine/threonine protein kinase [Myxococcales bacterium]